MTTKTAHLALAAAVATAVGFAAQISAANAGDDMNKDKEKCYGVSLAGKNDCASAGNNSCAGTAKADYEKGAWKYVAKGTCTTMGVTLKDGTKRMGSLEPVKG